ncbi:aminopeptidase [candidate division WOR-3 bacterium]|uniref:Aminopeptidase n=1 Tax=candidate division WOR-3 bacterium TaxID=2052148 RepID=A0A9D5K859_UNCW3|nr:aminopeptidase [candidate division WOR-3 bacterium]MBD3364188.1 aminopeptidase [candidate division WOR-3 bacterium]
MPASRDIKPEQVRGFEEAFRADPRNRLARNAATVNPLNKIVQNRESVIASEHTFSHLIEGLPITNQKKSGRCWMFAGLNLFRLEAAKNLKLKEFELSQAYLMFFDKLEKANYFLENILETADEPLGSRLFMHLMNAPIPDAGQWDMFVNLVRKYGVIPKVIMPETESSSTTWPMNKVLSAKLREYAAELRKMHKKGSSEGDLRTRKSKMLEVVYRMLAIHMGEPPSAFNWQWRDKDNKFHRDGVITPHEFYEKYVKFDMDSTACLINCPTQDKPFNKMYTIEYLGNMVGGDIIRYLNVDIDTFKKAAVNMIADGKPVWFGCDVGKMIDRDAGILNDQLYDYGLLYNTEFKADKVERVDYGHSVMTHAMVLTGVDLDEDNKPVKWRVENSWGDKVGDKGYFVMSDAWFEGYTYEIAVEKKYLSKELLEVLETEPVRLPPWDPMGALAFTP